MSNEGTIRDKRIDLGSVSFDSNVTKLGENDVIYTITENRTAFFSFKYDLSLVEDEINSDCKSKSKDLQKPRKGDLYLLLKIINPQTGQEFIVRKKI